ncbi:vWA domain-containing protein [Oceanicoccus sagamiensis]|uniref:BatB protein n=1 Tax=Oceanicoccus sagamiensis TaxID=716816 RepID=A0A1X9NQT6_9GAMM|nr:VWA domain-containing protein [Oceanicoccus sagamiensis]ARN76173.1 BatB protein [Oceanicoccus sagamiensis]
MLTYELPWVIYLLPLPLLAFWLLPKAKQQQAAVRVPFYQQLSGLEQPGTEAISQRKLRLSSLAFIWCGLLAAASGPTWIGDPISLPASGRDLLLAVDLSGSMNIEDMVVRGKQAARITAVKAVLNDFIQRRKGDRLGLVLFGSQAYVQAPLTFDRTTVQRFMKEAQIGFAGEQNTAIGDAIGLSVKRLRDRPGDRHVMILLTDGQNNGGEVKPIPAAKLAADNNIVIYTVGVGADEMVTKGMFGSSFGSRRVNPSADLDEKTLQQIADMTGGKYFRARNPEQLLDIYRILDELEPVEDKQETFRPQKALFYWPLAFALGLSGLLAVGLLPWRLWWSALTDKPLAAENNR